MTPTNGPQQPTTAPPQTVPPQAPPPQPGVPPQGYPPQGYPPQGYPAQGVPPQPGAPVQQQPVVVQVPVPVPVPAQGMGRPQTEGERKAEEEGREKGQPPTLRLYAHSSLFYWWPAWAVGFLMALVTAVNGKKFLIGDKEELFATSSGPGVVFLLTLFLLIMVTSVTVRGLASVLVIVTTVLIAVVLAYFELWDPILNTLGELRIHMNFAAYFWFSTLLFVVWAVTFFIVDHMRYWEIKPGQITENYVFGTGSRTYDTRGMVVDKYRSDLFRHWIIGLGAGDIRIKVRGATQEEIDVPNVLFVGNKMSVLQEMIAIQPDAFGGAAVR
jgi:hypothetical protein